MDKTMRAIESVEQLLNAVQEYGKSTVVYRGVTSVKHELKSKVGRLTRKKQPLNERDERYLLMAFQAI